MPQTETALTAVLQALADGSVEVVDLTQPLTESTPVIRLPEPFANTPGLTRHEISRYDDRGPAWAWSWLEIGEHVGTHFDAPIHWITGRDGEDLASVPAERLVGPAVLIDKSAEAQADPDYLLTIEEVRAFESEHGPLPDGEPVGLVQFPDADLAAAARGLGADGLTVREPDDLAGVRDWLAGPREGPLVVDAKVVPHVCAEWLEEAFRGG